MRGWELTVLVICPFRIAAQRAGVALLHVRAEKNEVADAGLVIGSALFGFGWGSTGLCLGPAIVSAAASLATAPKEASSSGLALMLQGLIAGTAIGSAAEMMQSLGDGLEKREAAAAGGGHGVPSQGQQSAGGEHTAGRGGEL